MRLNSEIVADKAIEFEHPALQYVIGNSKVVAEMGRIQPLQAFSEPIIEFFNDLSKSLLKYGREYSDVGTFGFWCRKSALLKNKNYYPESVNRLGKGVVFHSTPSNVPVNFAFSFAAGLLAGNANIVRIPGKSFEQVDIISSEIRTLLETTHKDMAPYIVFVKFPPEQMITNAFCSISNVRVIWGGDETIKEIRKSPLPARSNEITFADRYSIALIDADGYLAIDNKDKIAQDFFNDTYFSDQNACTAPRVIIWIGSQKEKAKKIFWEKAHALAKEKYALAPVQAVGKLTAMYRAASQIEVRKVISVENKEDNLITRIAVKDLDGLMKFKYNSGFFFEYDTETLNEILPLCDERCQTLTYCGMNPARISDFIMKTRPRGIDRVVPMGKSMDFALIWDGHDLIREMSRYITIL